jgi:hypothetical protein
MHRLRGGSPGAAMPVPVPRPGMMLGLASLLLGRSLGRGLVVLGLGLVCCAFAAPAGAASGEPNPFGIASFSMQTTEPSPLNEAVNEPYFFDQATGHPFALTSTVRFATEAAGAGHAAVPAGDPKDLIVDLPPGLLANPQALARCSGQEEHCPTDTQVGVFTLDFAGGEDQLSVLGAIVNMTPYTGQAAELGLEVPFLGRVLLTGRLVRTAQGYSLALVGRGLPVPDLSSVLSGLPALHLASIETTLWGVPAAAAHDPQRGLLCFGGIGLAWNCQGGGLSSGEAAVPFLTMPSACSGAAPTATAWVDSWEQPGQYVTASSALPAMAGCERLPFSPEVEVRPETSRPDEPVGVDLKIRSPQLEYASAIVSTPPLRGATVTLPQGVSINPAVANGLQACDATGPAGIDIPTGLNANGEPLAPGEVGPGEALPAEGLGPEEPELAPGHCPNASILGTVEAKTPLLAHPLEGRVYLAAPACGGEGAGACTEQDALDGNLYRLYVELGAGANVERDDEGVLIKLAATVQANPATGQLTVRLTEMPQLPLGELNIHLFGGPGALLANPATCGPARTSAALEPWGAPYAPDAAPSSFYDVSGCAAAPALRPQFLAGSVNVAAGAFSPFTLTVSRSNGEPYLAALQLHAPSGLSALLASVPLCSEALASTGSCPAASRVGGSQVTAGSGSAPLYMPGEIYLTGPYEGAPYGLAIVTPAVAGPLNLGTLVIRARIEIDPRTAALTITSDPLPQIVLGVPLRIQRVALDLDRPRFVINPTNCDEQQLTATIAPAQGPSAEVSNPFGLADCESLDFEPRLTASTSAHATFAGGASLELKLTFPKAEPGSDANLAQIAVELPKQLPSRLTTLQGACRAATFDADPATCPSSSVVGVASAQTPVLPGRLSGPVYLLAHGPRAFPSPVVLLQGDGAAIELEGGTRVEHGITSLTFAHMPDVPFASLEVKLPEGPHSALATGGSLCSLTKTVTVEKRVTVKKRVTVRIRGHEKTETRKIGQAQGGRALDHLEMPTALVGQNGAEVHRSTAVMVEGCSVRARRRVSRPARSRR